MKAEAQVDIPYFRRFPRNIAIELSSFCNSRCVHCPVGNKQMLKKYKGKSSEDLVYGLILEIEALQKQYDEFRPHLILYGNGEPLLHKKVVDFVQFATDHDVSANLSTNNIAIRPGMGKALTDAGLRFIKLSFWGDHKEEYERRSREKFEDALARSHQFISETLPHTKVDINVVKYRNNESLLIREDFLNEWRKYTDKTIVVYSFFGSDWAGQLDVPELKEDYTGLVRQKAPCVHFRDTMTIAYDGTLYSCFLDFNRIRTYGAYEPGNLLEIWSQAARQDILDKMEAGDWDDLSPCNGCSAPYTERTKERALYTLQPDGSYNTVVTGDHVYDFHDKLNGRETPGSRPDEQSVRTLPIVT